MNNQGNLILAVTLSLMVLVGFHYFYDRPRAEALRAQQLATSVQTAAQAEPGFALDAGSSALKPRTDLIAEGIAKGERVKIDTPRLHGSLNLRGARLDDLTLANYRTAVDATAPEVVLLAPGGSAEPDHAYYAEFGWLADAPAGSVNLPKGDTLWKASGTELKVGSPLALSWDNGQGLVFERVFNIDENFLFTVKDTVSKKSGDAVTLYPFSLVSRHATPQMEQIFILHEGPIGVFDGTLRELDYSDLKDDGRVEFTGGQGGWLGITDKYWLVALMPDQAKPVAGRFSSVGTSTDRYQVDARGAPLTLQPGASVSTTTHLFAGAKEVKLLDLYERELGVKNFDLAVDFGWFYFLTKPFFHAIDAIAVALKDTGYGFALAILLFTVLLKTLFLPLQAKSYRSMNRMRQVQPLMMELRERWAGDRQRLNMEMFELYRREKINPMSGCWPILLQIPVFFALYKVLYVTIEMRHAPFFGWVHDLSAPDPSNIFTLFGLLPWDAPSVLHIGVWPILMGLTMMLQQRLSPPPGDPVQRAMFRWLPVFFTVLLAKFPAGLVIYWTWSNALGIAQQYYLLKRHPRA